MIIERGADDELDLALITRSFFGTICAYSAETSWDSRPSGELYWLISSSPRETFLLMTVPERGTATG